MVDKKKKLVLFNPSSRNPIVIDEEDLDYIREAISEAGIKMAESEDKRLLIMLMGLIRKKLRDDPTFAPKLRDLLELEDYFKEFRSKKKVAVKKVRVGNDYHEYEYELGC